MPDEQSTTQHSDAVPPGWQVLPDTPLPHPTYFPAGLAMGIAFLFWGLITTWVVWLVGLVLFIAYNPAFCCSRRRIRPSGKLGPRARPVLLGDGDKHHVRAVVRCGCGVDRRAGAVRHLLQGR